MLKEVVGRRRQASVAVDIDFSFRGQRGCSGVREALCHTPVALKVLFRGDSPVSLVIMKVVMHL